MLTYSITPNNQNNELLKEHMLCCLKFQHSVQSHGSVWYIQWNHNSWWLQWI